MELPPGTCPDVDGPRLRYEVRRYVPRSYPEFPHRRPTFTDQKDPCSFKLKDTFSFQYSPNVPLLSAIRSCRADFWPCQLAIHHPPSRASLESPLPPNSGPVSSTPCLLLDNVRTSRRTPSPSCHNLSKMMPRRRNHSRLCRWQHRP